MAELVVLLRGDGTNADRRRTIEALERRMPKHDLCVLDPSEPDDSSTLATAVARGHDVLVAGSRLAGAVVTDELAWEVVRRLPDTDVVLLEIGCIVGPGWYEQLRRAAYADTVIATSSAIHLDMLELHDQSAQVRSPANGAGHEVAMGEPLWGCVYIRREALDIASGARGAAYDRQGRSGLRIEEFILVPGLVHALAPTVVVPPAESTSHHRRPALTPGVRRALAEIEAASEPLRVTVDLRCCASALTGTQVHALNLAASLAARDDVRLSVLTPARIHDSVRPHLNALPSTVIRHRVGRRIVPSPHVFHRPYQIFTEDEITDVVTAGARLVVTHQDMILDRTPAYFPSAERWRQCTATTALTFVAADEVVFFSEHARGEAVRDGLIDPSKTSVVPPGTNHFGDDDGEVMPPSIGRGRKGSPFVLVIGNAYFHKNRLFALWVTDQLHKAHGWDGAIVFAGDKPETGSSTDEERDFLREHRELGAKVIDLPRVTDAERRWLYRNAVLVLFPTLYEGFGLVPFEAAAAGSPCVYSSRSSVAEFLPPDGALLDLSNVTETARRLHDVLKSVETRNKIVEAISYAASDLTWSRAADSYLNVYRRSMSRPVGFQLVLGREVVVGTRAQMVSNPTERRILTALRRSAALRMVAAAVIAVASSMRHALRRLRRH